MNYENRYKEALEKSKRLYEQGTITESLAYIFPELRESEDEKIKGDIIATIHLYYGEPLEDEAKEMISWLEKQGETFTKKDVDDAYLKGVSDTKHELGKQGEQKPYGQREECLDCQFNYAGECKGFCQMKINEQKSTWSEEDEVMIEETLYFLREYQQSNRCKDENGMQNSVSCEKWLKSLKERIGG